ncbi:hypothetical protein [Methanocaldococcus sp. FS406-22]|uniref:hypothetical protein n=1 Tax=Methanocaldococcus sp. (strain FS406-22) TaxID=644281 RepID=UPI000B265350|nr:hypothetical protein [Methanocaldococcus sp. FS406-22]
MKLWSERIKGREVLEVLGCERVPLTEALNEIIALSIEYIEKELYDIELMDDVCDYYQKDILSIDKLIEGSARIKLGLDTRNHAKYWLLEVVNWFAGNRYDLKDDEIRLGNRLRDWMNIGVSLVIPKELKPKFDEFYKMAKEFDWELEIRDNVMFKTTLNCKEVYVVMLMGDVVNERLDSILDGGGVFDLGKRVVCDDEWFSGWLVKDIDVNKKYVGGFGSVVFEEPGNSGYFSGECFNKRKDYKNRRDCDVDDILWLVERILSPNGIKYRNFGNGIDDLVRDVEKIIELVEKLYKTIEKLKNDVKVGDISKINKSLDDLEWNVYKIEDYIDSIKNRRYKPIFECIINSLADNNKINNDTIKWAENRHLRVNKNLKIVYDLFIAISEVIEGCKNVVMNKNLPDFIVRRLNIINTFIEKLCNDILSIRENEGKTLGCVLSKLYNSDNGEKLANEVKEIVDSLYFDCYDAFVNTIGEYEFRFIKNLASMSLIYDYAKELKKDDEKELFNHIIFKILKIMDLMLRSMILLRHY